jgi:hypothetical protein
MGPYQKITVVVPTLNLWLGGGGEAQISSTKELYGKTHFRDAKSPCPLKTWTLFYKCHKHSETWSQSISFTTILEQQIPAGWFLQYEVAGLYRFDTCTFVGLGDWTFQRRSGLFLRRTGIPKFHQRSLVFHTKLHSYSNKRTKETSFFSFSKHCLNRTPQPQNKRNPNDCQAQS